MGMKSQGFLFLPGRKGRRMVRAKVIVRYKPGILDPEGKTICDALKSLGFEKVDGVETGKYFEITFAEDVDKNRAEELAREACERLLANPVIQNYSFEIVEGD